MSQGNEDLASGADGTGGAGGAGAAAVGSKKKPRGNVLTKAPSSSLS